MIHHFQILSLAAGERVKLFNQNKTINNLEGGSQKLLPSDFYIENGIYVFTKEFHLRRGSCCGNGCRHCPFFPAHKKGNTTIFIDNG
jgi:hypothetical protein